MNEILLAALVVCLIGLFGGILLTVASKAFAVTENQKPKKLSLPCPAPIAVPAALPGAATMQKPSPTEHR